MTRLDGRKVEKLPQLKLRIKGLMVELAEAKALVGKAKTEDRRRRRQAMVDGHYRPMVRAHLLAYAFLTGTPYPMVEAFAWEEPNVPLIEKIATEYGIPRCNWWGKFAIEFGKSWKAWSEDLYKWRREVRAEITMRTREKAARRYLKLLHKTREQRAEVLA